MVENVEGEGSRRTDKGEEEEEEESSVLSPISVEYEPLGVHRSAPRTVPSVPYLTVRTVPSVPYLTVPGTGLACACIHKATSHGVAHFGVYLSF